MKFPDSNLDAEDLSGSYYIVLKKEGIAYNDNASNDHTGVKRVG